MFILFHLLDDISTMFNRSKMPPPKSEISEARDCTDPMASPVNAIAAARTFVKEEQSGLSSNMTEHCILSDIQKARVSYTREETLVMKNKQSGKWGKCQILQYRTSNLWSAQLASSIIVEIESAIIEHPRAPDASPQYRPAL